MAIGTVPSCGRKGNEERLYGYSDASCAYCVKWELVLWMW
jgi:hypothetical protein